jgi:hypothetical protein
MRIAIFGALVALSFASGAQAQVGANENGGVCFGAQCAYPDTWGSHPNGFGPPGCSGVWCDSRGASRPDPYVPYPTVAPDHYQPSYNIGPAPNPFRNGFNDEN